MKGEGEGGGGGGGPGQFFLSSICIQIKAKCLH